jgi:hypothetical protein
VPRGGTRCSRRAMRTAPPHGRVVAAGAGPAGGRRCRRPRGLAPPRRLGGCGLMLAAVLLAACPVEKHAAVDAGVFNPRGSFVMTPSKAAAHSPRSRSDQAQLEGTVSAGSQTHGRSYARRGPRHALARASGSLGA